MKVCLCINDEDIETKINDNLSDFEIINHFKHLIHQKTGYPETNYKVVRAVDSNIGIFIVAKAQSDDPNYIGWEDRKTDCKCVNNSIRKNN